MGKPKTDPKKEADVCELKKQGYSLNRIAEATGVKKGTVREILKRNGLQDEKPHKTEDTHAPARPTEDEGADSNRTPNRTDAPQGGINQYLTQVNTSHEIIQFVQFFRSRTKKIPYDKLTDRDKIWAEGNYGKRWAEGIKMMVDTTGLSAESLLAAIDDYETDLTDALDRFNSKYRE